MQPVIKFLGLVGVSFFAALLAISLARPNAFSPLDHPLRRLMPTGSVHPLLPPGMELQLDCEDNSEITGRP
jgi:hypothetical protein